LDSGIIHYIAIILTTETTSTKDICGDGIIGDNEACDDNLDDGVHGCEVGCTEVIDNFLCTGEPSVCVEQFEISYHQTSPVSI